jgi:hypothetical protein
LDSSGNAYLAGNTASSNFPTTSGALQTALVGSGDAFVTKLNPAGSALIYSTYLGGTGSSTGSALAIDASGSAYVGGSTNASNFPVTANATQPSFGGGSYDGYVSELNASGSTLLFSTFLGGSGADAINGLALDSSNNIYVSGSTNSINFPVTAGAFQGTFGGVYDAFVTKLPSVHPTVSFSPTSLSFGPQLVGSTSASQSVTLKNAGSASLTIASVTSSGDFALTTTATSCPYTGGTVASGASCTLDVTFTPTATGARSGALTLTGSYGGVVSQQTIGLTGSGAAPLLAAFTTSLTFSGQLLGTTSAAQAVTLSNTGTAALTIASIGITGDFSQTNNCGSSVAASLGSCTINVTFTPTATGTRSGTLTITDNNNAVPGSTQTVSLTGTGTAPVAGVSTTSLTFSNQNVGSSSTAQAVTLSNTGTTALTLASITVSGANASDFSQTNTCAGSVAASGSCSINVTFTPTANGTRTSTLTITDNTNGAAGSTQTVSLTGTGTSPVAGVSPTALTFAALLVNSTSSAQAVTLSNTGNLALTVASITTSGNFAQTNNCGSSVAAGTTCTINVTFTPLAGGALTGTLTITDNTNNTTGSTQTVSLTGTGQDFTLAMATGAPSTITVPRGQPAAYSFAVGGLGGISQSISFTCSGAPTQASCTVSPSTLTPTSSAQNITLLIFSTAPSSGAPGGRHSPPAAPLGGPCGWWLLGLLLTAGTGALWGRRQARARLPVSVRRGPRSGAALWALAVGMLLTLAAVACHRPYNAGTPAGTYTLTVTGTVGSGSTAVSHSVNLTLTLF